MPQSTARWRAERRSLCRSKPTFGVIAWDGCETPRATCGLLRRASKKRRRMNGASDGPRSWRRRTDGSRGVRTSDTRNPKVEVRYGAQTAVASAISVGDRTIVFWGAHMKFIARCLGVALL